MIEFITYIILICISIGAAFSILGTITVGVIRLIEKIIYKIL